MALDDTRYAVEVSVRPLDLFVQVREDALEGFQAEFAADYAGVTLEGLTAPGARRAGAHI